VQAALSARVRSATRSSRLSESRRSTSDSASGSTLGSRSLPQAASAVARASSPSFSCGRCRSRAPARVWRAWVARPPPTRLRLPTSGPSICPNLRHSPPPRATLGEPFRPAFERSQAGAVLQEASTLDEFTDGFVDYRDGDRRLVGIDPDEHSPHARTHLRSGQISATLAFGARDTPTLSRSLIPLLSHSARRVLYGGTQA
jgi:hypothetical protein